MMRSLFSAISGLRAHQTWMDVIGNNIANVNTTGFKEGRVRFTDVLYQLIHGAGAPGNNLGGINPEQIGLGASIAAIDTIQTQGALQMTGKPTDLAIQGDGFFIVQDASGNKFYTRDGAFGTDANGDLVNPATGMHVLDASGNKITIPNTIVSFTIDQQGNIIGVDANGNQQQIAQIGLATFANPAGLSKVGQNLFAETPNSGTANAGAPGTNGRGLIASGYLEMSNVDLAQEFTNMILAQRGFQANARTITTSDEMLQELVNLKR